MYREKRQFAALLFERAEVLPQDFLRAYSQVSGSADRRWLRERLDGVARDVFDGLPNWREVTNYYNGVSDGSKERLLVRWADELFASLGGTVMRCDAEPGDKPFFEVVTV